MKVSLFIACFNDTLFSETGRAVVSLLKRFGHEIDFPEDQTCIGQMHYNTGCQSKSGQTVGKIMTLGVISITSVTDL